MINKLILLGIFLAVLTLATLAFRWFTAVTDAILAVAPNQEKIIAQNDLILRNQTTILKILDQWELKVE